MFACIVTIFSSNLIASEGHNHSTHKAKSKNTVQVKGTQKVCPIRKEKIDPTSFVEFQGQRIYFCCQGCDKKFLNNSEVYFSEMKARGEVTDSIQTKFLVSGDELDKDKVSLTLSGRKLYFCCKKCVSKFKKDKEGYLSKMNKVKEMKGHEKHDHSKHDH
jgi:YHS domain-containing protein